MDRKALFEFAEALGVESKYSGGDWTQVPCVLAPWQHSDGVDSNPSAGFLINPKGKSFYHCWTCQERKNLHELVMKVRELNKNLPAPYPLNVKHAYAMTLLEEEEEDAFDLGDIGSYEDNKKARRAEELELVPFDEDWLDSFAPILKSKVAVDYLKTRKQQYPDELYERYGVVYDSGQGRICFPTRSFDGTLYGLHGRAIDSKNPLRYFAYGWYGKRNPQVWMGESLVDLDKPLVLTEGMFDMMSIARVYPNVLASRSSEIHKDMWKRIAAASMIVTFYDNGQGGDVARKKIEHKCKQASVLHIIPSEDEDDAGDMDELVIKELLAEAEII